MTEAESVALPPLPEPKGELLITGLNPDRCEWTFTAAQLQSYAREAVLQERARILGLCELSADAIRLLAGEMTAQEMRTVRAVLANRAAAIRSGKEG